MTRSITLEDQNGKWSKPDPDMAYKVVRLKNSTDYKVGVFLSEQTVSDLCLKSYWDVTIV